MQLVSIMDRQGNRLRADRSPQGVCLANWQDPPFNRWAFLHLDELLTMAPISRGGGLVRELPRDERETGGVTFEVRGERMTIDQMLAQTFTDGFLVLHEGKVVTEQYADGMSEDTLHLTMSVSKSLTAALAGVLTGQRRLDPAAPVTAYVRELRGTSFDGCTVQHLLDMRAGTQWSEDYGNFTESDAFVYEQVMGWRPRQMPGLAPDMFAYMASLKQNARPHGGPFEYRSILTDVLGWVLERAGGQPFAELFSREIWSKLGAERDAQITIDTAGCAITDGGICTTLRDLARFGQLYLDGGGIVPSEWAMRVTTTDGDLAAAFSRAPEAALYPGALYHDLWWVISPGRGIFTALGIYGQMLLVHRTAAAVVAKFSTQPTPVDLGTDYLQITGSIALCEALSTRA
jgi:CubicO group peptidase (beta-lactamase class C family)